MEQNEPGRGDRLASVIAVFVLILVGSLITRVSPVEFTIVGVVIVLMICAVVGISIFIATAFAYNKLHKDDRRTFKDVTRVEFTRGKIVRSYRSFFELLLDYLHENGTYMRVMDSLGPAEDRIASYISRIQDRLRRE